MNIYDYRSLRIAKQREAEHVIVGLYTKFKKHLDRNSNIREKVRAKHLFREKINWPGNEPFTKEITNLFEDWFAFDYITIQGLTMLQLYIKDHKRDFSEQELFYSALLLTAVLEPVIIIEKVSDGQICAKELLENKKINIMKSPPIPKIEVGSVIFVRKIPTIGQFILLYAFTETIDCTLINELKNHFKLVQEQQQQTTWRTFLKKYALQYILNGKTDR
ncbi:hypothetical protein LCL95_15205 [Bacillus timonensis]|nr:hypothetical protein [Bacillus timonensis]